MISKKALDDLLVSLYKAAVEAHKANDLAALGLLEQASYTLTPLYGAARSGPAFDLYLTIGLLKDTPEMGVESLHDIQTTYPEYFSGT